MAALNKKTPERTEGQIFITPEYGVYTFRPRSSRGAPDWERTHTTTCPEQARHHAEILMQTNEYPKIEIHKKYFDVKKDRTVDCAVKIYGDAADNKSKKIAIVLAAAIVIAVLGFLLIHPA